jgi:rubrerythrin
MTNLRCLILSKEIKKIEDLSRIEQEHASNLSESVKELKNVVVQEILRGIAHDSRKHAGFYTSILSILKGESPAIGEEDYDRLEEVITEHIYMEERMMGEAKQLLDSLKDLRIRHLLTEIYDDEVKHHTLMKRILEAVVRREAIFEEDWWDAIWKDVPGHGAPIG